MKAKYSFEMIQLDDETVAVPVGSDAEGFNGVLKVNETAAAILKLLEQDTSVEEIVENIMTEYSGDKESITAFVRNFISKLDNEGILE